MAAHSLGAAGLDGPDADGPLLALLRVLADGAGPEVIGSAIAEGLLREHGPTRLAVYLVDAGGEWLEESVRYGPREGARDYARIPMEARLPLTDVVRSGEAGAWTYAEAVAAYPAVAGWVQSQKAASDDDEVFAVPIRSAGRTLGALLVTLPGPVERTWRLRLMLDMAAVALAVWSRGSAPSRSVGRGGSAVALTSRQARIVNGIEQGWSNAEIAADLAISVATVKADLARLYRVFGVSDRTALPALVASSR